MNVYDFDQTVFFPDSSYCFVTYCMIKYPRAALRAAPGVARTFFRFLMRKKETRELKESVFSFLRDLPDVDAAVAEFWEKHRDRLEAWYLKQKREDDLIISASPEFLLRPIAEELGVRLIATVMDKQNGRILGKNCHDKEKVRRFREVYPEGRVEEFYSDSLSDSPMAALADRAFLVKRGVISSWPKK